MSTAVHAEIGACGRRVTGEHLTCLCWLLLDQCLTGMRMLRRRTTRAPASRRPPSGKTACSWRPSMRPSASSSPTMRSALMAPSARARLPLPDTSWHCTWQLLSRVCGGQVHDTGCCCPSCSPPSCLSPLWPCGCSHLLLYLWGCVAPAVQLQTCPDMSAAGSFGHDVSLLHQEHHKRQPYPRRYPWCQKWLLLRVPCDALIFNDWLMWRACQVGDRRGLGRQDDVRRAAGHGQPGGRAGVALLDLALLPLPRALLLPRLPLRGARAGHQPGTVPCRNAPGAAEPWLADVLHC